MKKLLWIAVLGLILSINNSFAKDLTGTKLLCSYDTQSMQRYTSIEFLNQSLAKLYKISTPSSWIIISEETKYKVTPNKIKLGSEYIDREKLTYGMFIKANCEIRSKEWEPLIEMKSILKDLIKKQEKKNKI